MNDVEIAQSIDIVININKNKEIIKDNLFVACILCSHTAIFYNRLKALSILPNLIISSAAVIINQQHFENDDFILQIFNTIVNSITLLLVGLSTSYKISENADLFRNSTNALTKLLHDLENKEMIENGINSDTIILITNQYDMVLDTLPPIPYHIRNKVRDVWKGKKHLPIMINGYAKEESGPVS